MVYPSDDEELNYKIIELEKLLKLADKGVATARGDDPLVDKENYIVARSKMLVLEFFNGDEAKTKLWFETPNPLLGDIAPNFMIEVGRSAKLLKFILNLLDENKRSV